MRVSIQYSIELDKIPLEMQRLVDATVVETLDVVGNSLRDLFYSDDAEQALKTIDEARQCLFSVDERLSDIDSILRGYIVQRASEVQSKDIQKQAEHTVEQTGADPQMAEAGAISEEAMKIVRAKLAEHKLETDTLRRTMNLGFNEPLDGEGVDDES
tara:strand:+ start:231 stop:701 length:471 start_codon:yes stop_codon:yes gene_type:complete